MFALERQQRILEILAREGSVSVSRLSAEMDVTEETIRRDLEKLEKKERLRRTHGGAVPIEGTTTELSLEIRKHTNVDAKAKLAKSAVEYVVSGDTIFLDASTTTFFMAKELRRLSNITVITNSMRVVNALDGAENIKVIAVGGLVSNNQSFVGTIAEKCIAENYYASKAFFSSKGVTTTGGILESNEQECGIKKKMLKNATTKYYICDSSKIERVGFAKLCGLDEIDYFITDKEIQNEELKAKLTEYEVKLLVR